MADLPIKDFAPGDEDRARFRQSIFGSVMGQTAVCVGLLIFILGGLAFLATQLKDPVAQLYLMSSGAIGPAWGALALAAVPATIVALVVWFNAVPAMRQARAERRDKVRKFEAVPEPPRSAFRLTPYQPIDREAYARLDGQDREVLAWLQQAAGSVFYLSGDSGVGKSSLIGAFLVPSLLEAGWAVMQTRAYGDAMGRLSTELRARSDVFPRAPDAAASLRDLLASGGERRRKAGKGPLLVILDQFEEVLILADPAKPDPFRALVEELAARPLEGVKLLLVYRSDYETEIFKLALPTPVPGGNAFRLGRYNRRESEAFLKTGGRLPSEQARDAMFGGLDRIEGVPGLYRQITLNMVGLFLERMGDQLTRDPDRLIQGYLESCLREGEPSAAEARRRVVDTLVSDAGTKQPRGEAAIAGLTGLPDYQVKACLHGLAEKGLVRAIEGEARTWEPAHDFLAALLGRTVPRARPTFWSRVRPALGPVAVAGWLGIVLLGLPWWQGRAQREARDVIEAAEGSIHRTLDGEALEVRFDRERLSDCDEPRPDWDRVMRMVQRLRNVAAISFINARNSDCRLPSAPELWSGLSRQPALASLDLSYTPVASLADMPVLPALASLNLYGTQVASLADMPVLPALAELDLSGTQVASLADMPVLPALASLNLYGTQVASLADMPVLPALAELYLYGTQVASLADMPVLPALAILDLSATQVASLADMPVLPALASLNLYGTQVASLAGMPVLPALAILDLSATQVASLADMPVLPALAELYLSGTQVASLADMPVLPALAELYLSGTQVASLAEMPVLPALAELYLSGTQVASLAEMPVLPALAKLDLSATQVASLAEMPVLPALAELYLSGTQVASLAEIPVLPALAKLDLYGTQVASLADMPVLPALAELYLSGTQVASLAGMPVLPALAKLDLSGTQVASLAGMPVLPALAILDLSATQVASLADMPVLPALAELYLSGTQVASLAGMPVLPALAELNLSETQVASLAGMPVLPALKTIYLRGTEVNDLSPLKRHDPVPEVFVDDPALLRGLR